MTTGLSNLEYNLFLERRMDSINGWEESLMNVFMLQPVITSLIHQDEIIRLTLIAVFPCKSGQAIPYISAQHRKRSFLDRMRAGICNIPIKDTGNRKIELAPWPESISSKGIIKFVESSRPEAETMRSITCKPDIVVFATGYSQRLSFVDASYGTPLEADRRGVWKTGDETVGFIGFVRPAIGAIPPLSELQVQL
jgi:dimethylaniline monooxygenase (N-oxide forming)